MSSQLSAFIPLIKASVQYNGHPDRAEWMCVWLDSGVCVCVCGRMASRAPVWLETGVYHPLLEAWPDKHYWRTSVGCHNSTTPSHPSDSRAPSSDRPPASIIHCGQSVSGRRGSRLDLPPAMTLHCTWEMVRRCDRDKHTHMLEACHSQVEAGDLWYHWPCGGTRHPQCPATLYLHIHVLQTTCFTRVSKDNGMCVSFILIFTAFLKKKKIKNNKKKKIHF